ncbi:hypothetical protein [Mixta mediterraneensis]|uniref:hypothetical protein n=1 Tax=Mixta mediterraneensis TaxID=2758443 RepID=UPI001876A98A|nr:hypothetical protein [Mixta mediterraneensis]MBE5254685.1 hypothetical protein [Mixta mediterraneensis]
MKTSELIVKLQEIDKTVPFDADIVTGEDWLPQHLTKVYHEPPYTFIEFESYAEDEWGSESENNRLASITELATRAHMLEQMVEMIEKHPDFSPQDISHEMKELSGKMHSMIKTLRNK